MGPKDPTRTQSHSVPVVQGALNLLNQPMNPVRLVSQQDYPTIGVPADQSERMKTLSAFRLAKPDGTRLPELFVNKQAPELQIEKQYPELARLLLGGMLAHEQTHDMEGSEFAPSRLEADFVYDKLGTLPEKDRALGKQLWQQLEKRAQEAGRAENKSRQMVIK